MNQDREMIELAKATLRTIPTRAKAEKGMPADHKAMTIITYDDGSSDECWGHSKPLQVASVMRKAGKRDQTATVQHVIRIGNGRGQIVSISATHSYTEGRSGGQWA